MTQADRDRLVTLRKAKKKLITQREAAEELGLTVRHVKRLIYALQKHGDKAVVPGLRGRPSNRRIEEKIEREAVRILSASVYQGFGPTLAAEYLRKKHSIKASKETVRQWMMRAKLWRGKKERVKQVHTWRPRRSRFGELVQWDTSEHDWLEGRGEKLSQEPRKQPPFGLGRMRCGPADPQLPEGPARSASAPILRGPKIPLHPPRAARRRSDWNKNFDLKKAPKIWQAAQAPVIDRARPCDEEVAERQSSPYTGKRSARPAGKPGDFLLVLERLRRSLFHHSSSATATNNTEAPSMRF